MTRSSSLTKVSSLIAKINQEKENTVRQRLKEWYLEAEAKSGKKRAEIVVIDCFADLLKWIIDLWPSECKQLALALDATTLKQNFTVLSIHVLYRGCGIPIAWKVVKATQKGSWRPHWQQLFQSLVDVVPTQMEVIVFADRGLYADWLYKLIRELHWHPFLRINHQGQFRCESEFVWKSLASILPHPGTSFSAKITCFKTNPIECTLSARWDHGYQDPRFTHY
ncbi:hypothetical protein [Moorena sp. SIO3I6]|uniref:hypothetical protein n=1 Tax=Moorena sp. SIO3I6 TaxID=2607831 RepID=UPI0025E74628|nr:hypothetical protein [Moorena sp. SIO3I6]